jgi:ATP-dependent Lon protease
MSTPTKVLYDITIGEDTGNAVDLRVCVLIDTERCNPYLECTVDLSRVCYIATANASFRLSGPLLDRLRVLEVPQPRRQDLPIVVKTLMSEIRAECGEDEIWLPDLDVDEMEILSGQWRGGSLRPLRRMIETLLAGWHTFAPRH